MKIEIEIPEEFIGDWESDRFEDFFQRALADMNGDGCGGNYERETARMFICAFKNGIINNQPQVHPIVRTQADRIRNMSDEELAELIDEVEFCKGKVLEECEPEECNDCAGCCSNTLAWLQSEAEREEV